MVNASAGEVDPSAPVARLIGVVKEYPLGKTLVRALAGVDLTIFPGELTLVSGPSGSGKTTMLNLIGCVDVPSSGTLEIGGQPVSGLSDRQLTSFRLHHLGFIFQSFNLVNVLTAYQNVELPLLLLGVREPAKRRARVEQMLERVGLADFAKHRPGELSGGQRQRVSIARALITKPRLVLADEPTANLDSKTGTSVMELMAQLNREEGTTFVVSTHDPRVLPYARRILQMRDGRLDDGASEAA